MGQNHRDLERRRISLSVKQAAEGGVVAEEYQEHFGEQNYDTEGNYIGTAIELDPEAAAELDEAWSAYEQSEQARLMGDAGVEDAERRVTSHTANGGIRDVEASVQESQLLQLLETKGAKLVDADEVVRDLQQPGGEIFVNLVQAFGDVIVTKNGELDRQKLADIAFSDPEN